MDVLTTMEPRQDGGQSGKKSDVSSFWSPEMAHDVIETPDFLWGSRICDTLVVLFVGILLVDHVYMTYFSTSVVVDTPKNPPNQQRKRMRTSSGVVSSNTRSKQILTINPRWFQFRTGLTTAFIVCSFFTAFFQCLNIWSVWDSDIVSCQLLMYIYCVFYHFTKLSLYCIFIVTSFIVFNDSKFAYPSKFIFFCLGVVCAFGAFLIACTNFAIEGVWLTEPSVWCHIHIRNGRFVEFGFSVWIIGSLILYICSVILFLKPLLNVIGLMDVTSQNEVKKAKEHKVNHLIIKITLLNGIAIISSCGSLLVYLFTHITIVVDIDIFITSACVLIATSRHMEQLYRKLCKPCHNMGTKHRHRTIDRKHRRTTEGSRDSNASSNERDDSRSSRSRGSVIPPRRSSQSTTLTATTTTQASNNFYYREPPKEEKQLSVIMEPPLEQLDSPEDPQDTQESQDPQEEFSEMPQPLKDHTSIASVKSKSDTHHLYHEPGIKALELEAAFGTGEAAEAAAHAEVRTRLKEEVGDKSPSRTDNP